jgi:hypothetical protein
MSIIAAIAAWASCGVALSTVAVAATSPSRNARIASNPNASVPDTLRRSPRFWSGAAYGWTLSCRRRLAARTMHRPTPPAVGLPVSATTRAAANLRIMTTASHPAKPGR